jgi:two-component system response regulator (stage 0 sporulation protein F)
MTSAKTVLIVDDQDGIRKLLEEATTLLGYAADTVSSGAEALERIRSRKYQLALVDMKMPGISGLETLLEMRALDRGIKTVLMTGYGESFYMEEALKKGADGVILKPFDLEELRELFEKLLQ